MRYRCSLMVKSALVLSGMALATTSFMSGLQGDLSLSELNRTEGIESLSEKERFPDFRALAKKAIPAVVFIKVQNKKKSTFFGEDNFSDDSFDFFGGNGFWQFFGIPRRDGRSSPCLGQASGVIVNPGGYILTNSHVVNGMDTILVQLHDGREFPAKLLGEDTASDVALIKIDAQDLPYLPLGNSDELEVGQWVAAIGNPFGLQATLTTGVVSGKSRNNLDIVPHADFIQTDATINSGNSGGPLITLDGKVVGINTAIATSSCTGYTGIGFAIPSNMARHVMEAILSDGKVSHGLLGISLQSMDYNLAKAFGLKKVEGALVANVIKNSAADRAGLQVEDIILRYNDHPVENAAALRNAVYMMKPGTKVVLTVLRKDQQIAIPVIVGDRSETSPTLAVGSTQKDQLGIGVENLTAEMAQRLGYTQDKGVLITNVSGIAAMAGLKKGALILAVNRQKISSVEEFYRAVAQTSQGQPVLLQVKQGDLYLFISLQVE